MSRAQSVVVGVDVMSGDGGSSQNLEACRLALQADADLCILACGEESLLQTRPNNWSDSQWCRVTTRKAEAVLPADAGPALALRQGQDSSMAAALRAVGDGTAHAAVSGGSTGALMVLARQMLGMLPGIDRPALMAAIPTARGLTWMLDLGANIQVDAARLAEFARLGHVALSTLDDRAPRTALLNIGTEPGKGPDAVREAARLLEADPDIDYQGFIEADQVFEGHMDLVVCDGFSGNVLLKSAEGALRLMFADLKASLAGSVFGFFARPMLRRLNDSLDPARHNGAPMLGVKGTVIKSHGGASAEGFANAIALASLEARRDLSGAMQAQLWAED
jgi:glycerol-3-phosphate acyltransferase PlsX